MRNRMMIIAVVGIMLLVVGCSTEYREITTVESPCWTDNGKIAYIKEYKKWKIVHNTLGEDAELIKNELILMECNNDGTGKEEKGLIFDDWWYPLSMNSSGIWIVMSVVSGDSSGMYVMKTDGTGLQLLGAGMYPDLSPDGSKIVYSKKNEGIWIMNRDGTGDHRIVSDTTASYPAWSPDDTLIAYGEWWTHIVTLNGDSVKVYPQKSFLDWGPKNSNLILIQPYNGLPVMLNILTEDEDTLHFGAYKWSKDGKYIVGSDSGGYYSINIDGTDKHYLEP